MALTPDRIRAYREDFRSEHVPPGYRGGRHLLTLTAICLLAIGLAIHRLECVALTDLLALPLAWLVANLVEYATHRGSMHRLGAGLGQLYRQHTSQHHRFFSREVMAIDDLRDVRAIASPLWMAAIVVALLGVVTTWLLGALVGPDFARLAVVGGVSYYLAFEWLHLGAHLPEDSPAGRLGLVRFVRRHHAIHHDPAKMRRTNFNFALPLGDWLFGTWER